MADDINLPPLQLLDKLQTDIIDSAPIENLIINDREFTDGKETLYLTLKESAYLRFLIKRRMNAHTNSECKGCKRCCVSKDELVDFAKDEILKECLLITSEFDGNYVKIKTSRRDSDDQLLLDRVNEDISRLRSKIRNSKISYRFKKSIQVQTLHLNSENRKDTWHGVLVNPAIVRIHR